MPVKTTTYVRLFFRRVAVTETVDLPVRERDLRLVKTDGAFAVQFHDILSENSKLTGKEVKTRPVNFSNKIYLGGLVLTAKQVMQEMPHEQILLSDMTVNGWEKVIQTRSGHYLPFNGREDIVINP